VYHVYKNNNNLETSLNSIATQSDKEFEFILINDGATQKTLDILTKYNLISICKNIKYIFSNTNRGHAFSFNEALKQSNNSYIYYMGSNIVLEPDFIKTINETIQNNPTVDVISITHLIKNTEKELLFHSLSSDLKYYIGPSSRDKIFSISFLKKNNIKMNENGYFSIEFLYQVLLKFKT
jgi:glycosyltransferase involved in cell wall biosynthesis